MADLGQIGEHACGSLTKPGRQISRNKIGRGGMSLFNFRGWVLAVVVTASSIYPASAQKSADNLRIPLLESRALIDQYLEPGPFNYWWAQSVYDNLISFDPEGGKFVSQLAKSWTQLDGTTFDFVLRDNISWHDGQPLTADDVIYTISYLIDPRVKLRLKAYWDWIESVEKLGPFHVRVKSNRPVLNGLIPFTSNTPIYPKHLHEPLVNKFDFGAKPIGTGPYRITKLDKNSGIAAQKSSTYVATPMKNAATIGRVTGEPIFDTGAVVAAILTDKLDLAPDLSVDQAIALRDTGRFEMALMPPNLSYTFVGFPTKGAQNVKALADPRVRTAIAKAIDRKALIKAQYGSLGDKVTPYEALCVREQLGCGYSKGVPEYDPAGAKKLLQAAGYGQGFDVVISTFPFNSQEATIVSGMLRVIGIRASVQEHPVAQRVQLLNQGRVEIGYYSWGGGAMFDVAPQIVRHFLSGEYDDPTLTKMANDTLVILDDTKQREAATQLFDYATDNANVFAMLPYRPVLIHTKEVRIADPNKFRAETAVPVHEYSWR